jgi:hypothetical protein
VAFRVSGREKSPELKPAPSKKGKLKKVTGTQKGRHPSAPAFLNCDGEIMRAG